MLHIRVPATTANIGSGFDTLGLALSLYNDVYFDPDTSKKGKGITVTAEGEGAETVPLDDTNMLLQAMAYVADKNKKTLPAGKLHLINRIPLARGLGSSSATQAAGVLLASLLLELNLAEAEMIDLTSQLEGHPDNAVPAIRGGFCIASMQQGSVISEKIDVSDSWRAVVAIPEFELKTEDARAALPDAYSRKDAVHNVGAVSFLLAAFIYNKPSYLACGLDDRIHVPYRLRLIPGGKEVMLAAKAAGAYGATISGAGPTMIAFCPDERADAVGQAMVEGFHAKGILSRFMVLSIDTNGIFSEACERQLF
ncbi:MAG: homoserine kinase [Dialister sp.]|nr:homoserine kinase [Dialister sp.]